MPNHTLLAPSAALQVQVLHEHPDATLVIGTDGVVHYANLAARALALDQGVPEPLHDPIAQCAAFGFPLTIPSTDGTPMAFDAVGRVIEHPDDASPAMLVVLRPVTTPLEARRAAQELEALRERLRLFVAHTPAAVAMFDTDLRYLLVSEGWYEQYGLTENVIGRTHYEVFPTVPQRWRDLHQRALRGEFLEHDRDPFAREDGSTTWVRWKLRPWRLSNGTIGGIIMFTEVVTAQVERELALEEATTAAKAANRAKTDFLANMSHEIRTPMTAILGYANLLAHDLADDPERAFEAIRTIRSNGAHLLTLINDVLDVSKIEAHQMTVESIETDLIEIVEEVATLVRPRALEKGLALEVRYESPTPTSIRSDPTRLRPILVNLACNAVKFTQRGQVSLLVTCEPHRQEVRFRVVDTGIGMSDEVLEHIREFRPFSQADTTTTRRFGGTGLGLVISNALAELLGGQIEIDATVGEGSTFTLTVATGPLDGVPMVQPGVWDPARRTQATPGSLPRTAHSLEGLHIVLAEDGPDNQRLLAFLLKRAGARVTVCDNGRIAVDEIVGATRAPDLVLMDMQMPELDGYDATRALRARGLGLPIVALTAHAMQGDRQRCLEAGCDDYLTKPVDRKLLIERCWSWTRGRDRG